MKMRLVVSVLAVTVLCCAVSSAEKPLLGTQPNIVMIVVDDWGHNDAGLTNTLHRIHSPNIDNLAATGVTLQDYNVYRFCSPTRSTYMTGRLPYRLGQNTRMNLNPTPGIACGINLEYKFMADVLKSAGYNTHALGKWHLGFLTDDYTPTKRGFDTYLGYYSGAEEHFTHEKAGAWRGFQAYDLANSTGSDIKACKDAVGPNGTYSSYLYANETIRLIENHDPSTGPLFFYEAFNNVHDPCEAPQSYIDANSDIKDAGRRNFAAMVQAVDDGIGGIIQALKNKGIWENSVIVLVTDNGGNLGGSGNNYPLRGGKYTFWNGGVRGLGFVNSPLLPSNTSGMEYWGLASMADWYATFAALAGVSTDNTGPEPIDGLNIWPNLVHNTTTARDELLIQYAGHDAQSMPLDKPTGVLRMGKWKLILGYPGWTNNNWNGWIPPPDANNSLQATMPRWCEYLEDYCPDSVVPMTANTSICDPHCLFDIMADPTEHHDLSAEYPDIVSEMTTKLLAYGKNERTVNASGLCPTSIGTKPDPGCLAKAKATGFWEPWLASQ